MRGGKAKRVKDGLAEDHGEASPPPWVPAFLAELIITGSLDEAVAWAGIDFDTAWALRTAEPAFAHYWDKALRVHETGLLLALAEDEEMWGPLQ